MGRTSPLGGLGGRAGPSERAGDGHGGGLAARRASRREPGLVPGGPHDCTSVMRVVARCPGAMLMPMAVVMRRCGSTAATLGPGGLTGAGTDGPPRCATRSTVGAKGGAGVSAEGGGGDDGGGGVLARRGLADAGGGTGGRRRHASTS